MLKFLFPFLSAFFLTIAAVYLAIAVSKKIKWHGRDSDRHIHHNKVFRLGGLAMVLVFNIVILLNQDLEMRPELYGFMIGSVILLIVGIWDDIKEIFWKVQLFFQIAVAVLIFIMGVRIYYITNPFSAGIIKLDSGFPVVLSAILAIVWIIVVMNAINWADGIDGLSGGISMITVATIFFLSLRPEVNQPTIAIICSILAGVILGFLIFNFNPSRIIAGTSGAMFMGFSLAVLAIFSGAKIATAILVLAIPIIDFLWVISERIRQKKSIFRPGKNHLHYKLMEIGWSQKKVVFCYWTITAAIALVAINTRAVGKSIVFSATALIMISVLISLSKKISNRKKEAAKKA